jgi:hypothetical protein
MEFRAHITGYMRTVYRCIPPTYCPAKFQMVVVVYVPPPMNLVTPFFVGELLSMDESCLSISTVSRPRIC